MKYPEDAAFDHHDAPSRDHVVKAFDLLLSEMSEHHYNAEILDEDIADEAFVAIGSDQWSATYEPLGMLNVADVARSSFDVDLQAARDQAMQDSGHRIRRVDEIRALRVHFVKRQPVSEVIVEAAMVLFRQLVLRSALVLVDEDRSGVEQQSSKVLIYTRAYAALGTASMLSAAWGPFDEYCMLPPDERY